MEFHKAKTILMKPLAFSQKFYFVQDGFYKRAQEAGEMRTILFFFAVCDCTLAYLKH